MKIGILTISKSEVSYGANLQCYALWKYISSLNLGECEVLDLKRPCQIGYKNPKHEFIYEEDKKKKLVKYNLRQKLKAPVHVIKNKAFRKFWKLLDFSKPTNIDELYETNPQYDILISGSDQIWNFNMPFFTEVFFQTFIFSGKKISYASSLGSLESAIKHENEIKKYLTSYSNISVREDDAERYLTALTGQKVNCSIDPVFLLSMNEWDEICLSVPLVTGKYIFAYSLNYTQDFLYELELISQKYNVKIVTYGSRIRKPFINNLKAAGPKEFINLIKNSWYIVTDSFHCIAFSLIYKKSFVVVKNGINEKTISRIETLISYINAEENLINQDMLNLYNFEPIHFTEYNTLLSKIEDSKKYLEEALHE